MTGRQRWLPLRGTSAIALLVGSVAALVASRPLVDNSFFTHLATGRVLVDGDFPQTNPFLWTGTTFPIPSWWWSGILGVADWVGGAAMIRLVTGILAGILGALLVRLTAPHGSDLPRESAELASDGEGGAAASTVSTSTAPASSPRQRTLLAVVGPPALTLFTLFPFLNSRPQLAGFVLLALTVVIWRERLSPWLLVPIFVTWINVHGTWLYGVMVLGLLVAAEVIDTRKIGARVFALLASAVGGTVVGAALYPKPFELLMLPTRQFGNAVEREAIRSYREWAPLQAGEPIGWAFAVVVIAALWGCIRTRRWAMGAVTLLLALLGVTSSRMVPIAAVALVPFAAMGVDGLGSLRPPQGRAATVVTALGVSIAVIAAGLTVTTKGFDLSTYPVAAVDWLEERNLVANPEVHVVSHDYVGNYLELRYGTRAHAYVDDRPDAQTLLDYRSMRRFEPDWKAAFDRSDADVVVWESNKSFPAAVARLPGWTVATRKGKFTILCRDELAARCA